MYFSKDTTKVGLEADLTQATAATINALRLAFATQRILEKDARFGTRYREILKGHFGVTASDEALLVPEYLGGQRTPINIETVLQNSSTDGTSPLGHTGAFSVTGAINEDFTKSFTKDDILIGVLCVRADHTYQQGLARQFTRERRLDRYWTSLAHIGNQPIYNGEIYAQGNATDNEVFGFKEAWQEYIYQNNRISGELLSTAPQSLDVWHYGDDYDSLPVLSDEWIREPQKFIDRTLAVQGANTGGISPAMPDTSGLKSAGEIMSKGLENIVPIATGIYSQLKTTENQTTQTEAQKKLAEAQTWKTIEEAKTTSGEKKALINKMNAESSKTNQERNPAYLVGSGLNNIVQKTMKEAKAQTEKKKYMKNNSAKKINWNLEKFGK